MTHEVRPPVTQTGQHARRRVRHLVHRRCLHRGHIQTADTIWTNGDLLRDYMCRSRADTAGDTQTMSVSDAART